MPPPVFRRPQHRIKPSEHNNGKPRAVIAQAIGKKQYAAVAQAPARLFRRLERKHKAV
ncbi:MULTISPECIES: hypothetical protein [unclassified Neisseria]|uniref:hypothetical protein n=1 Tax=unclassified Neisseria TaxID=2623750 RepID=UPI00143095A9|nr:MULTISPECIES: hypothetical protein [unclassified Neisseria]MBF0804366.1 hypothetical protein [Neisseria sp. 19428wB4_WF04]